MLGAMTAKGAPPNGAPVRLTYGKLGWLSRGWLKKDIRMAKGHPNMYEFNFFVWGASHPGAGYKVLLYERTIGLFVATVTHSNCCA